MSTTVKYPKGEIVWTGYYNAAGERKFILTSKETRDCYFLYKDIGNGFEKLGKAKEPPELIEKFRVMDALV